MLPLLALALLGCTKDDVDTGDDGYRPDHFCPGSPGCEDADGTLEAGAAVTSILPACWETWEDLDGNHEYRRTVDAFADCGCDRLCPGDDGYVAPDEGEGDGTFQTAWIGGFGHSRAMNGVRGAEHGLVGEGDGLWARTVVLRQGETTLAIVALDAVGIFLPDVDAMQAELDARGLDVDDLLVHATHDHEAPDTMGIWGPGLTTSGVDPEHTVLIRDAVADAVEQSLDELRPVARLVSGRVDASTYNAEQGVENVVDDSRDPWVIDESLYAARLVDGDDQTIATLINWGCHPEAVGSSNLLLTSDFVHALRRTVETGSEWEAYDRPGVGGVAIYLNAMVGGLMTTLHMENVDPDGNVWEEESFEKADAIGQQLGEMALDALEAGVEDSEPSLSFQSTRFHVPVHNIAFRAMFLTGVLDREMYNYDDTKPLDDDNVAEILTEIMAVQLGPIHMLTVPGELAPELGIGGYDGSHVNAPGRSLVDPDNPNPPDLSAAPEPPYLVDRMGGTHNWIVGLGNDELGYILPEYDFQVDDLLPYIERPEGDHYEETNSLSPEFAGILDAEAAALLGWVPAR